jgi:hypothetical protein
MTALNSRETSRLMKKARTEPLWWAKKVLGVKPWPLQAKIIEAVASNKRITVRSCSGSGKSWDASVVALWFLYNHYPATVITTAPTFRQVESILWREIRRRFHTARVPLGGKLHKTSLELDEAGKWFAIGMSTDEPERFQGFHNKNVLVIVDEASGISEEVYQAIENPLAAGDTRLMLLGNPTQTAGTFYRSFGSPAYGHFHISAFDTPNFLAMDITEEDIRSGRWREKLEGKKLPAPYLITPEWVADRYVEWGEGSYLYRVYVKGEFPEAGVDSLFKLPELEAAVGRETAPQGDLVAALDVSRYGDDETVYLLRRGDTVSKIVGWSHRDTEYTRGRTIAMLREDNPLVIRVDDVGVGGPVADTLEREGFNVDKVNVGEAAIDGEHFLNRRAELYWLLSRRFTEGKIALPDNRKLVGQLSDVRYTYNRRGQLQIESKEEMKRRGSRSPDIADALMMAFIPTRVTGNRVRVQRWG